MLQAYFCWIVLYNCPNLGYKSVTVLHWQWSVEVWSRLGELVTLSVIFSPLIFVKSFWLSLTHSFTGIWQTWHVLNVAVIFRICACYIWEESLNRPKVRWRVTWRPFFCTNAFRIISRFYAIQFRYQYRWITQHKCRKPYHKTNLNRIFTTVDQSHQTQPVLIFVEACCDPKNQNGSRLM